MPQDSNKKNNNFFNIGSIGWGLLVSAVALAIISGLLAYLPKPLKFQDDSYWSSLFYNLSSAFAASAVLTLTLEFANNYQRNKDLNDAIQQIQSATTDGILKELIGDDSILSEVKTHIFKQNYVRKDFRIAITLLWDLESLDNSMLLRKMDSSYSIWNLTSQRITYQFKLVETKDNEAKHSGSTKITATSYDIKDNKGRTLATERFTESTFGGWLVDSADSLKLEFPVDIPPNCYAEFKFSSQSLLPPSIIDPIVSLNSTTDMEIDLVFPYNIRANAFGIHPDPEKFELQIDQSTRKRWRAVGLLPGQGILLALKIVPDKPLPQETSVQGKVASMLTERQLNETITPE